MVMSNQEIVSNFLQAKKPAMQVNILADLNATTPDEIKRILREGGVDARKLLRAAHQNAAPKKKKAPSVDTDLKTKTEKEPDKAPPKKKVCLAA